jgi:hypothetical protein
VCVCGQNIQFDHVVVVTFLTRNEMNINGMSLYEHMGTWPQRTEPIWSLMSQLLAAGVFMFHYQSSHDTKPHVVAKIYQTSDLGLDYICPIFLLCHYISNPHIFHSMPYALSSWHTILNALQKYKGALWPWHKNRNMFCEFKSVVSHPQTLCRTMIILGMARVSTLRCNKGHKFFPSKT